MSERAMLFVGVTGDEAYGGDRTGRHDRGHPCLPSVHRADRIPPQGAIKARCRDLGLLPIAGHEAPVHVYAIARKVSS